MQQGLSIFWIALVIYLAVFRFPFSLFTHIPDARSHISYHLSIRTI